jgi:colanic acid/amylovoran biosynthesis glycosyltransferase
MKRKNICVIIMMAVCFFDTSFARLKWKKMNVLVVVPSFPKIHDVCMLNQITGLINRGHEVTIFAYHQGDTQKVQEDVIAYNLLEKTIYAEFPENLNQYDVVIFQLGHRVVDIKKTHNYKGKVVVCLRGYDITGFLAQNPNWYDELIVSCDLFLPVCERFKEILEGIGCKKEKIIVHYSGIDCSRFAFKERELPQDGAIKIVSAGRFVEKKGFEYAIAAVAQLLKKYPKVQYTILGEGKLEENYRNLIREYKVGRNIQLMEWHPHEEYIKILDNSDIFILSSVTAANDDQEGIPNVLKEAMAMGLLVVATKHSGNAELLKNGAYGFLVEERSRQSMYDALDYILSNPDKWSSMRAGARKKITVKFDKEKVNDKLEKILLKLTRGKK